MACAAAAPCFQALGSARQSDSPSCDCKFKARVLAIGRRKNHPGFKVSAIASERTSSSDSSEPALAALERIFYRGLSSHDGSEVTDSILDERLRDKEEKLRSAEALAELDQRQVERKKSALVKREVDLGAAVWGQGRKVDEIERLNRELADQTREAEQAQILVGQQERQLQSLRSTLVNRKEAAAQSKAALAAKDEALSRARRELKTRDSRLQHANQVIAQQSLELNGLRNSLKLKEDDLRVMEEKLAVKQEQVEKTQADLNSRVIGYLSARKELDKLEQEVARNSNRSLETETELGNVRELLAEVQEELKFSQMRLQQFKQTVEEQAAQIQRQQEEIETQKSLLDVFDASLEDARERTEMESERVLLAKQSYKELEEKLACEREESETLVSKLIDEKVALQDANGEVHLLKRELQRKEAVLSDTRLVLQLKEAELAASRVELQKLRSECSAMKVELVQKDDELKRAQTLVGELQEEVGRLKCQLSSKEVKHDEALAELREKEEELVAMRRDLDANNVKLSEITSAVEQINALSGALVESITDGNPVSSRGAEGASLNKVFELEEVEVTKQQLLEKDVQLEELQRILSAKNDELVNILQHEHQHQHQQADVQPAYVSVEDLQPAVSALQNLVQLSGNLYDEFRANCESEEAEDKEWDLRKMLVKRDEALDSTRQAVDSLTRLTRELLIEASCP